MPYKVDMMDETLSDDTHSVIAVGDVACVAESDRNWQLGIRLTIIWAAAAISFAIIAGNVASLTLNAWGDVFAGFVAPVAFFWLILGYSQQGKELKANTAALHLQAEELARSVKHQADLVEVSERQLVAGRTSIEAAETAAQRRVFEQRFDRATSMWLASRRDLQMEWYSDGEAEVIRGQAVIERLYRAYDKSWNDIHLSGEGAHGMPNVDEYYRIILLREHFHRDFPWHANVVSAYLRSLEVVLSAVQSSELPVDVQLQFGQLTIGQMLDSEIGFVALLVFMEYRPSLSALIKHFGLPRIEGLRGPNEQLNWLLPAQLKETVFHGWE